MIKIKLVVIGKLKESFYRDASAEYLKRLSRFARVEVAELPERRTLKEEADDILKALKGKVFVLAIEGEKLSSEKFAEKIKEQTDYGNEITFVIGSSCGLDGSVKSAADFLLSFSDMTFPHQLMRVVLLEQIYRSFMIISGSEYHK